MRPTATNRLLRARLKVGLCDGCEANTGSDIAEVKADVDAVLHPERQTPKPTGTSEPFILFSYRAIVGADSIAQL